MSVFDNIFSRHAPERSGPALLAWLTVLENPWMLEDPVEGQSPTGVDDEQLVAC